MKPNCITKLALVGIAIIFTSCKPKVEAPAQEEAGIDTKKVESVMTFLREGDINSGPYEFFEETYFNRYSDFAYDKNDKSLSFTQSIQSPEGTSWRQEVIYLESAKPVIQIETFESNPPTSRITLVGKGKKRDAESKEQLADAKYEEEDEMNGSMLVNKEIGPRLKAALEDLLKVHGVEVSAY